MLSASQAQLDDLLLSASTLTPPASLQKAAEPHFKVVVSCYNAFPWIEKSLLSIASQSYSNYTVCVVDDASTDPQVGAILEQYVDRPGWTICRERVNRGSLASMDRAIELLAPDEEDVVVAIDGDDWLAHTEVFSRIAAIYAKEPVDATYGQHTDVPSGERGYCFRYSHAQLYRREFRKIEMGFGHLRTFRAFLWNEIRRDDFFSPDGRYIRLATDWAHFTPILEMAGERARFVDEILYVYNRGNPINEFRIDRVPQKAFEIFQRSRKPYPRHPRCMRQTPGLGKSARWQDNPTPFLLHVVGGMDERTEESIDEQTYPYVTRYDGSAGEEDVIVEVRAGDWFLRPDALEHIANQYATGEVDATFGDALFHPQNKARTLVPYSFSDLRMGRLDDATRGAAPPYTYRASLWEGDFMKLLQRVRHRACFIDLPIYVVGIHGT